MLPSESVTVRMTEMELPSLPAVLTYLVPGARESSTSVRVSYLSPSCHSPTSLVTV